MALNWSSSSNSSSSPASSYCIDSDGFLSMPVFMIIRSILIVPFALWVLHSAHRRWRQQHSSLTMSHSEIITYNMAAMHLFEAPGGVLYMFGFLVPQLFLAGFCISTVTMVGEILFHVLTCIERYLAVIYPLTYLKLKDTSGVRIRTISIGLVWLFAVGWSGLVVSSFPEMPFVPFFFFTSITFVVVAFCSLSVLCVLIRPKHSEVGGDKVDPTKRKAFNTIVLITTAIWLLFLGYFICIALSFFSVLSHDDWCLVFSSTVWLSLPSSLVAPLLFLNRAEKLKCPSLNTDLNTSSAEKTSFTSV